MRQRVSPLARSFVPYQSWPVPLANRAIPFECFPTAVDGSRSAPELVLTAGGPPFDPWFPQLTACPSELHHLVNHRRLSFGMPFRFCGCPILCGLCKGWVFSLGISVLAVRQYGDASLCDPPSMGPHASAQSVGRVARLSGNVRQPNQVIGD
jgi:hypothetical protein